MTSILERETARFWAKVVKSEGCWLWTGFKKSTGYGVRSWKNRRGERTHRIAWMLERGEIPPGLHVLHHCDTPACVRPDHLWLGTHAENMKDGHEKGRFYRDQCKRGHLFTQRNTRIRPDGRKACRACRRNEWREKHPNCQPYIIGVDGEINRTGRAPGRKKGAVA